MRLKVRYVWRREVGVGVGNGYLVGFNGFLVFCHTGGLTLL